MGNLNAGTFLWEAGLPRLFTAHWKGLSSGLMETALTQASGSGSQSDPELFISTASPKLVLLAVVPAI